MNRWTLLLLLGLAACDDPVSPGEERVISTKTVAPLPTGGSIFAFESGRPPNMFACVVEPDVWDRYESGDTFRCEWRPSNGSLPP